MDGWMDGWMNGWMDDWMDGWMDSLIGLMFTAMMSTELEATGHMQRELKRSKGSSGTQEWHLYRFSELMDTHGGKTSTSECTETALLHCCYIFANDLHCGQWQQSWIDDDKRGSRSEFCNKKVAKRVIKRGKWPPQMWADQGKTNVSVCLREQRQGSAFKWPFASHECLFDPICGHNTLFTDSLGLPRLVFGTQ